MPPDLQKRLPACDACKLRRVKCNAVPPPASCSRCVSKSIICTTSQSTRKSRTGVRVEAARAIFGRAQPPLLAKPSPFLQAELSMVQLELSGELVAHLLQLQAFLPSEFVAAGINLIQKFEASGRRISMLPRTSQTLVFATLAITARISSHPLLFGTSRAPPRLISVIMNSSQLGFSIGSIPEWGRRRENACRRLQEMALGSAWEAKLLQVQQEDPYENEKMAACLLLGIVEDQYAPGQGQIWQAAFVSLVRKKLEEKCKAELYMYPHNSSYEDTSVTIEMPSTLSSSPSGFAGCPQRNHGLAWSIHIMRDALSAASRGKLCSYTLYDEELATGPRPVDPEKILENFSSFGLVNADFPRGPIEGEGIRTDWWDFGSYYCLIRPFTYRMTEVSLRSYEWSLDRAHHIPFQMPKLEEYVASLLPLQTLLTLAGNRLAMLLTPMAVEIRRYAGRGGGLQHVTGDQSAEFMKLFEHNSGIAAQGTNGVDGVHSSGDELRAQETARLLHLFLRACMGASLFPVFNDIQERIQAIDRGHGCPGDDRDSLNKVLDSIRQALLPYVLSMLRSLSSVAHVAWVTSVGQSLCQTFHVNAGQTSTHLPSFVDADAPVTTYIDVPTPVPYSEGHPSVSFDNPLLHPSSFAWEGKVMHMFRMCTPPHLFSRASWDDPFSLWTRVLLGSVPIEDGGTGLSRAEKLSGIRILLDAAKVIAWAHPSLDDDLIREAREAYEIMKALDITEDPPTGSDTGSEASSSWITSRTSDSYMPLLPKVTPVESIPTVKEVLEGVPHERISDVFFGGVGGAGLGLEGSESTSRIIEVLSLKFSGLRIDGESNHAGIRSKSTLRSRILPGKPMNSCSNTLVASASLLGPAPFAQPRVHSLPLPQDLEPFIPTVTMNYGPPPARGRETAYQTGLMDHVSAPPAWEGTTQGSDIGQDFVQRIQDRSGASNIFSQEYEYDPQMSFVGADGGTEAAPFTVHSSPPVLDAQRFPSEAELMDDFRRLFGGRDLDHEEHCNTHQGFDLGEFGWSDF